MSYDQSENIFSEEKVFQCFAYDILSEKDIEWNMIINRKVSI